MLEGQGGAGDSALALGMGRVWDIAARGKWPAMRGVQTCVGVISTALALAQEESMFFFVKKNQKTFNLCRVLTGEVGDSAHRSFLLLFYKKEGLPYVRTAEPPP
jgi:hypothetical protein